MNALESFEWALEHIKAAYTPNPEHWFCDCCSEQRRFADLITSPDPELKGARLYFCSSRCRRTWFDRYHYFNS